MKITATFLIVLIRFTSSLDYSADYVDVILLGPTIDIRMVTTASEPEKILKQEIFNPLLKTVFIIPGVPATINDALIISFTQNYINSKRYNVVYFEGAYYLNFGSNAGVLGEVLSWFGDLYGSVISKLIASGLSVDSIELVGHSWGAGVAYLAASNTKPKLPLLIGLDPTNVQEFRNGNADYTIAVHTNIGQIGQLNYNSSDSNIIANDGVFQAMCTDKKLLEIGSAKEYLLTVKCSHIAALYYWGNMIENPELFFGVECNEMECNYNNVQQLGPNLRSLGTFYFKTGETSPFGLGLNGIKNIRPMDQKRFNILQVWSPMWQQALYCVGGYCSFESKQKILSLLNFT